MGTIQFIFLGIFFSLLGVYIGIYIVNYYKIKELKSLLAKAVDLSSTIEEVDEFKNYSESSLFNAWQSDLISISVYCQLLNHIGYLCHKKKEAFNKV